MVDDYDLILSDQHDENDVLTILSKCNIIRRRPDDKGDTLPAKLPHSTFRCRFSLEFESNKILVSPYQGENEEWPAGTEGDKDTEEIVVDEKTVEGNAAVDVDEPDDEHRGEANSSDAADKLADESDLVTPPEGVSPTSEKKGDPGTQESIVDGEEYAKTASSVPATSDNNDVSPMLTDDGEFLTTDDDDNASFNSIESHGRGPETEGSNTKGSIMVGPEHQAVVPEWVSDSNQQQGKPTSRKPTLVWSRKNTLSSEALHEYMTQASQILTSHMQEKGLLLEIADEDSEPFRGLTEISTTSSVAGTSRFEKAGGTHYEEDEEQVLPWKRECTVDSLLEVLHSTDCDTSAALQKIKNDPDKFVTSWNKKERDMFNSGFRRFSGSLRMIGKGLGHCGKTHKDVIDYYYRFQIGRQFRLYQEQKRRQAISMMETIDKRTRSAAASTDASGSSSPSPAAVSNATSAATPRIQNWSRVSVTDVMHATDERTRQARELLTEVHAELGMDKLHQISEALQAVNAVSSARGVAASSADVRDLKTIAAEILAPTPALLAKFLDFLPQQHRA
mmetsp:Transcript_4684/g.6490  ORF Transcript_4684/g.6490 Transcript_4684/m.6490 type:complete len:562 (-) Transcript_4684:122-1807(-)